MTGRLWALVAIAVAIFVAWRLWRHPAATVPADSKSHSSDDGRPPLPPNLPASRPVPPPPAQAAGVPLPPIIDSVTVEKSEVCEGEENLVTVRAHTVDNKDDAFLHYAVGGNTGTRVPILGTRNANVRAANEVVVFGRNNVATTAVIPPFTVKECKPSRRVLIEHRVNPNSDAEFSFSARVVNVSATTIMTPVRYIWDFGDGNAVETTQPIAVHDFDNRPQDTLYSQRLIGCTAVAADGERVTGRDSLQLLNPDYESMAYKGIVRLRFTLTPRFPTLGDDGIVTQRVRIWHGAAQPVEITDIGLLRQMEGGASPVEKVAVQTLLGTTRIPPEGIEITTTLDSKSEPGVFSRTYDFGGWSTDGYPVRGAFSVLLPTAMPTRENSHPVGDAELKAKILLARELLGKQFVTDEDLWQLQRQGAFANLQVDPNSVSPATGPPPPKPVIDAESEAQARRRASSNPLPPPSPSSTTPSEAVAPGGK